MVVELVRQLAALGTEVHLGVLDNGGRGDRSVIAVTHGVATPVVIPCRGAFDPATRHAIAGHVRAHGIDLIHSHKYKTTFYALWARAAPVVATYHNWLTDTAALKAYALLDKLLARHCSAVVGVSTPVATELQRWVPAARVHQIGNGIDTDRFCRTAEPDRARAAVPGLPTGDAPLIGFVGRLSAAKGIDTLLAALPLLDARLGRRAELVLVGEGEHRATLLAQAAARGLQDRVHFLGTRADTPALYSAFDVLCLPSRVEAFPMVLLEAMACATPVVATDVGDVARMLDNGRCGRVVPVDQPGALAQALAEVLSDRACAAALASAGRNRVQQHYSAQTMAQRYLALYRCLVG
jgi:glycosyltransferase involved in cell wall biosynthesis